MGLHCHIGSQITKVSHYELAAVRMVEAMGKLHRHCGTVLAELDLGGGHAVPYREGEPHLDLQAFAQRVQAAVALACAQQNIPVPRLIVEPGRAIVATAGVTVYRVVAIKRHAGGRVFVAVDGGMSDNPPPGALRCAVHRPAHRQTVLGRAGAYDRHGPALRGRQDCGRRRAAARHPRR
jgi:diaminopimelate decarboxylase